MYESYRDKAAANFTWRFLERFGAKGVEFVVSIILARLLAPDIYGTIALVTVFTSILQAFVDSGFGTALIQKKDADNIDFSTVFFFNIGICLVLYSLLFMASPLIAHFYNDPELTPVIRVLGVTILISGIKNIQQAYVSRNLLFKRFFFATLGGTIVAAVVGIWMAYHGFGVWALVAQQITNSTIDTIVLWFTVKWRPVLVFSFERFKTLFSYGWKLLTSRLLEIVYTDLRQLIIGKMYSPSDLAYYNQGYKYPNYLVTNINIAIDSVLLPIMSKVQDDSTRVKSMTRMAIRTSTYFLAPLMIGMAACAESLVGMILTDKWLPCVPYLRIFCCVLIFYPIHTANLNAIKALGRSDIFLKLEIVKKALGFIILIIAMNFGVLAMAYSVLISDILGQIINSWPNRKLLKYGYLEQLRDIIPNIILALVMGTVVYLEHFINAPLFIVLLIQISTGIIIYVGGSIFTKNDIWLMCMSYAKGKLIKKSKPK